MSGASVDHERALELLRSAAGDAHQLSGPRSKFAEDLTAIIHGSHLTYRYILTTALLAKATKSEINPLALQAGAELDGAYDARSLCHKVVVPNERTLLNGGLGLSNEPFLNKPARFPQVSLSNAVRNGNDRRILETLDRVLRGIRTSREAYAYLVDVAHLALARAVERTDAVSSAIGRLDGGRLEIRRYLTLLSQRSHHGETAVLVTAGAFWLMSRTANEDWKIDVHPVNESGSSSNQVSDVDVWSDDSLLIAAEVKDKAYGLADVAHAAGRVAGAGGNSLHFIQGPSGELGDGDEASAIAVAAEVGVELQLVRLAELVNVSAAFAPSDIGVKDFAEVLLDLARTARMKDETFDFLAEVAKSI